MTLPDCDDFHLTKGIHHNGHSNSARPRLSRDLLTGRYRKGESLRLSRIAAEYDLDCHSAALLLSDLCALGMVSFSTQDLAVVRSSNPKEMYETFAIRAALEEISGRAAAVRLRANTAVQQRALAAMRAAVRNQDLDSFAVYDVSFHRSILEASDNDVLLRVWDSLAFDIRIRAAIANAMGDLTYVVESHQPIIDALERGQGREAGLLLRNHVETFLQFLKKAEMDAAFFRQDLEIARKVQKAFMPQQAPLIPGLSCDMFYKPAHSPCYSCRCRLAVMPEGETKMSKTFVLIHGTWHGGWAWREVVDYLSQKGHRAHAPTLAGHGPSAEYSGITHEDCVDSVVSYIERNGLEPVDLVGHSFGGTVVQKVAERLPNRIARAIFLDALILEHNQCVFDILPAVFLDSLSPRNGSGEVEATPDDRSRFPPPPWETWRDNFMQDASEVAARSAWKQLTPEPSQVNLDKLDLRRFYSLAIPKSFVYCRHDKAMPSGYFHPGMSSRLGSFKLVRMDGGHEVMFSRPVALAEKLIEAAAD